ncbi:hypothetical protein HDE_11394 [Halotydeus destructor]|nr:hypothetical protein HDE_11394 [Halotydeus destructor]
MTARRTCPFRNPIIKLNGAPTLAAFFNYRDEIYKYPSQNANFLTVPNSAGNVAEVAPKSAPREVNNKEKHHSSINRTTAQRQSPANDDLRHSRNGKVEDASGKPIKPREGHLSIRSVSMNDLSLRETVINKPSKSHKMARNVQKNFLANIERNKEIELNSSGSTLVLNPSEPTTLSSKSQISASCEDITEFKEQSKDNVLSRHDISSSSESLSALDIFIEPPEFSSDSIDISPVFSKRKLSLQ